MHKSKHSTLMEVTVPQGWKLVPIEPTDDMLLAGYSDFHDTEIWWSLMLDAAPAAPVATQMQPPVSHATTDERKALESATMTLALISSFGGTRDMKTIKSIRETARYAYENARAALAQGTTVTDPTHQQTRAQARAWMAVCAALDFVDPRWTEGEETGEECAVRSILNFAKQDADQTYKLAAEEYNRWIHAHAAGKDFDDFLADEAARKEKGE